MNPNIEYHDKLVIGEDLFIVHPRIGRLVDLNKTGNVILYDEMTPEKDHCYFIYNKKEKCLAPNSFIGYNNQDDFVMVHIPKTVLELKHERSLRGNDQINLESFRNRQGFQMLGLRYAERMLGITPQVKIGYSDYYFRLEERTLGKSLTAAELHLNNLQKITTKDGIFYEGLYNFKSHELLDLQPLPHLQYDDHYWVRIPEEIRLDPVGTAIKLGIPPYSYINQHPLLDTTIPIYQDRSASVMLFNDLSDQQKQLLESKQIFIDDLKAGKKPEQSDSRISNINPPWRPPEKEQNKNRIQRGKIQM